MDGAAAVAFAAAPAVTAAAVAPQGRDQPGTQQGGLAAAGRAEDGGEAVFGH